MLIQVELEIAEHLFNNTSRDSFKTAIAKELECVTTGLTELALERYDTQNNYKPAMTADFLVVPVASEEPSGEETGRDI